MPSHLRNGRDLSYEQQQRALEYQLSPAGAARLQRLGGQSATPGRRITIVGPGRTASGSRDKSGLDQLERDVPSSRIKQRDVSAAGIHQVHASTATSGQGELPSNPPTDPDFGADRHSSSSYSAHSDPLNGSRKFDGYYTRASGPEFLGNNSQQSMGNVRPSPRLPGHLDDEIFSQRGRRNPRDDPEQSRPRGNDPTQSGLERPRGTSSFGRAIPASEHPDAESRFTSGTPHGRLPPSSQQQQRRNAATTPPPPPPPSGYWMNQSMPPLQASSRPPSQHYQQPVPMDLGYEHQRHYPRNGYATNQFQPRPPGNWNGSGRNRRRPRTRLKICSGWANFSCAPRP
ncbi:hypothetical protein KEM48_005497 [Puccinia striiformis f. sp. tritici PST-130]|nr:hypothetical protein KEM48_005497 [Puccinia striiformis f. sp. tritici PST-130]